VYRSDNIECAVGSEQIVETRESILQTAARREQRTYNSEQGAESKEQRTAKGMHRVESREQTAASKEQEQRAANSEINA
jgi:hypothetical protein